MTHTETVQGKCGHDVQATVSEEGEFMNVPDCCESCEDPPVMTEACEAGQHSECTDVDGNCCECSCHCS